MPKKKQESKGESEVREIEVFNPTTGTTMVLKVRDVPSGKPVGADEAGRHGRGRSKRTIQAVYEK